MKKVDGFALVTTLLMVLVATVLAVTTIQVSRIQEIMSASIQDKDLAFSATESAMTEAKNWLLSQNTEPSGFISCLSVPCLAASDLNTDLTLKSSAWWQANATAYTLTLPDVSSTPRYVIEYIQYVPDTPDIGSSTYSNTGVYYYRITARGTGSSSNTVSMQAATVARRY